MPAGCAGGCWTPRPRPPPAPPSRPAVRISGPVDVLVPADVGAHAVAVVREGVSNAVRHGHAEAITLTVEAGDELVVDVTDDGTGTDPTAARSGLRNLEERAHGCGGTLSVTPVQPARHPPQLAGTARRADRPRSVHRLTPGHPRARKHLRPHADRRSYLHSGPPAVTAGDFGPSRGGGRESTVVPVAAAGRRREVGRSTGMDSNGVVVVGIDGSPGSRVAAEYALEDAARRGARLHAVAAAPQPDIWAVRYGIDGPPPPVEIINRVRAGAEQQIEELLAAHPDLAARVEVDVQARTGVAGEVLTEAARGADLLVIGHRGRGTIASAVLGSVGLYCVLHAPCPVTVVRPVPETTGNGAAADTVAVKA